MEAMCQTPLKTIVAAYMHMMWLQYYGYDHNSHLTLGQKHVGDKIDLVLW